MTDGIAPDVAQDAGKRVSFLWSVLRNPLGLIATVTLLVITAVAIFAPIVAPFDPAYVQIFKVNARPEAPYFLGGDGSGRDIFSRLVFGARNTLVGASIAVAVAAAIGVTGGLIAGYFGNTIDIVTSWIADSLMALPAIIVLLAFFQALGSSINLSMAVFGIMLSPGIFRLTRSLVRGVRNELYVDAARVSGLGDVRIMWRHILLVIRAPVVIQASIVAGIAIVIQAGLEFLGLGDASRPTWGGMLQDAFDNLYVAPLSVYWPGLAIAITVGSLVLLANVIRDRMQQGDAPPNARRLPAPQPTPAPLADLADDTLLEIRDLVVAYPGKGAWKKVVQNVSMKVRRGEIFGVVGESGSGKTQSAFAVLGLLSKGGRILSGSISFDGMDLTAMSPAQLHGLRGKRIAYVPQEPMSNLDPSFRIGWQLVEPMMTVLGISRAEATERALALLARVGLPHPERVFKSYPHQISGGMAQRVLIAGAVSCKPDLLIADEPTTALDVTVQAEVLDLMRDLQAEYGMSIIIVTHNFGVVADICDTVTVMRNGAVVETAEVHDLFAAPTHEYTKMLLSSVLEDPKTRTYTPPKEIST